MFLDHVVLYRVLSLPLAIVGLNDPEIRVGEGLASRGHWRRGVVLLLSWAEFGKLLGKRRHCLHQFWRDEICRKTTLQQIGEYDGAVGRRSQFEDKIGRASSSERVCQYV